MTTPFYHDNKGKISTPVTPGPRGQSFTDLGRPKLGPRLIEVWGVRIGDPILFLNTEGGKDIDWKRGTQTHRKEP